MLMPTRIRSSIAVLRTAIPTPGMLREASERRGIPELGF